MVIIIVPTFKVVENSRHDKESAVASTQKAMSGSNDCAMLCQRHHPRPALGEVPLKPVLLSRAVWSSALRSLQGTGTQDEPSPTKAPTVGSRSFLGTV